VVSGSKKTNAYCVICSSQAKKKLLITWLRRGRKRSQPLDLFKFGAGVCTEASLQENRSIAT
jgi:hypothetical protein